MKKKQKKYSISNEKKSNQDLVADIRGALTPFFTLITALQFDGEITQSPEFKKILQDNIKNCEKSGEKILSKLNQII